MTSFRALVVDDEKNVRITVAQALEDEGLDVEAVATARAALNALRQAAYDVVLLDLRLPDQSGLEVLRRIREKHPDLPVIMFTAYGSVQDAVEATRLGVVDFLEKPITPDELRAAIQSVRRRIALEEDTATEYDECIALAKRQVHQERYDAARNTLHEAESLDPARPEAHALLGIVHAAEGRMEEAERAYRTALRTIPDEETPLAGFASETDVPLDLPDSASPSSGPHRVLACIDDLQADRDLARYAAASAAAHEGAELVLLHVIEAPKQLSLSEAERTFQDEMETARDRLGTLSDSLSTASLAVRPEVIVGHDPAAVINNFMDATPVTHVMLGWTGTRSSTEALLGTTIDEVASHSTSAITLLRIRSTDPYEDLPQRIVTLVDDSPHAPYAARRAFEFAQHVGVATLTLLTAQAPSDTSPSPEEAGRDLIRRVAVQADLDEEDYEARVVIDADPQAALIDAAKAFGLISVGPSPDTPLAQALFGSLPEALCAEVTGTVAVVRGPHLPSRTLLQALGARLSGS